MRGFRAPVWWVVAGLLAFSISLGAGRLPARPARAASPPASAEGQLAAPVTDLVADGIEITQSIQDLNNSVPLVKGKRTFVRVYAHSTNGVHPAAAQLHVQVGNQHYNLLPIAPGGPLINVRPVYNRLLLNHAFLFELPLAYTFADVVTLTATLNPALEWRPPNPEEFTYANNTVGATVNFDFVPKVHLVIADQPMVLTSTVYTTRPYDRWKAADWLIRAFPVAGVKVQYRTLPIVQASRQPAWFGWRLLFPTCEYLQLYFAKNAAAVYGNPFYPPLRTAFLGLVTDEVGWRRGCAQRGGLLGQAGFVRAAGGPAGADDWGWDFDGSYADWYSAHEIGHAFGRPHVRGGPGVKKDDCGGEAKAVTHYPNGAISPTYNLWDPAAIYGFDTLRLLQGQNPIWGPYSSDVMTYCDYQWVSKLTYTLLKNVLEASGAALAPASAASAVLSAGSQDLLAVLGSLDPASGTVDLLPTTVMLNAPALPAPDPGAYAVVLYDGDGDEIARHPFAPADLEPGPSPYDDAEPAAAAIAVLVPALAEAALMQVEGPGGVLADVQAGLAVPAVQITSPNGGEAFSEFDEVTVAWTATDEDGDPLTFDLEYSADNGSTWEPVALFITTTQVTVPHDNLPAGDGALFRVTASDGLHAGQDASDAVFSVLNHTPEGEIVAPASAVTIAVSQTASFEARAYDNDLGSLDEELEWVSDQDGSLGTGAAFSTASLSEGLHAISLIAHDGAGDYPLDQVTVTVVATPNDLPPTPDALLAGPELVFLGSGNGLVTATLYLDNLNLGQPLAWEVSSSEAWVELSAAAGTAPQDITVGTTLLWDDFGQHKSLLTFTSPMDAFDPVYVVVIVDSPLYPLNLPLIRR